MRTHFDDLARTILREARLAVAAGLDPGEALGAVIAVAGILIGEVRDAALRGNYLQHAMAMLAKAVAHVSAKARVPAGEECRLMGWMQ